MANEPAGLPAWLRAAAARDDPTSGDDGQTGDAPFALARERMVTDQILARGIHDAAVVAALREVPRHLFVPEAARARAYFDHPLQIGHGQTISQPYIVALMTELVRPSRVERALEVGTGSGYQAAILSRVVGQVFTVEVDPDLHQQAVSRLAGLGYTNVTAALRDGHAGWSSEAPFDIVVVTAAPTEVPRTLVEQLAVGGRLVIPVGPLYGQELLLLEKESNGRTRTTRVAPVAFVPMVRGEDRGR